MIATVRIPEDRIATLIGRKGSVKKKIQELTGTVIEVADAVTITGEDPVHVLKAKDMVTAIGRGFSPRLVWKLSEDGVELHVVSMHGQTAKKRARMLGRAIGSNGRAKKTIEQETGASISFRGKTVSLIGTPDEMRPAEAAIEELLSGKTHAHAYNMMRRKISKS